jgi:hypothetical protein
LAVFLHLSEDSKSSLWWNEARDDLLSHVLCGSPEQVLQLNRAEFLNDSALLADALMESLLKLVKLSLFLIEVLDKPPPPLLHLVQSALKAFNDASHWPLHLSAVLRVPDVVGYELLNGFFPLFLEQILIAHDLELVHESINVLDEDIVSGDQYLLLLATSEPLVYIWAASGLWHLVDSA